MLLNRRGFATSVFCRQCGVDARVPELQRVADGAPRGAARALPLLQLRHAGAEGLRASAPASTSSRSASAPSASRRRSARSFPGGARRRASIATRSAGAARSPALLARFAAGEIDVLVGTQMIAKGHDFPRVTLVGVISADVGLGLADFRAAERTFQLLTQVAGRAGRGEMRGEAIVQTLYPDHYSIRLACRQDYPAFYREEITFRQAMRYPPAVGADQRRRRGRGRSTAAMHGRRRARARAADPAGRPSACSVPRRRRSAGSRASTARSSSSRGRNRGVDAAGAAGGAGRAAGDCAADDRRRRSDVSCVVSSQNSESGAGSD